MGVCLIKLALWCDSETLTFQKLSYVHHSYSIPNMKSNNLNCSPLNVHVEQIQTVATSLVHWQSWVQTSNCQFLSLSSYWFFNAISSGLDERSVLIKLVNDAVLWAGEEYTFQYKQPKMLESKLNSLKWPMFQNGKWCLIG